MASRHAPYLVLGTALLLLLVALTGDQGESGCRGVPGETCCGEHVGLRSFHSGASLITTLMSLEKKCSTIWKTKQQNGVELIDMIN